MPEGEVTIYNTGERFRWEAVDRTTETVYREDENGLGSFAQLDSRRLREVRLYSPTTIGAQHGEMCVALTVPEGASAVFTRRRFIVLNESGVRDPNIRLGWTIIGHRWPDGTGEYHFFNDTNEEYFTSDNFNAV